GPERRCRVVEPRGVQLPHGLGGPPRTPVALYIRAVQVGQLERLVSPIEVQSATAVTRHVLRSLLVVRGVDVGPQIHGRLPILLVRTPGSMRHINVERAHRAGPIAVDEEEVTVGGQRRSTVCERRVDWRTEVDRGLPRAVAGSAPRHPDVDVTNPAGPVRTEVE